MSPLPPHADFHEVWWIFSPLAEAWSGLRIAHFRKTINGYIVVVIQGESDQSRVGLRIWDDIQAREGWIKVKQIPIPYKSEIEKASKGEQINAT